MTMSIKKGPFAIQKSYEQIEEEKKVYQFFYGEAVQIQQFLTSDDIMEIKNCSPSTAGWLMNQFRKQLRREPYRPVLVSEYCEYMKIDEMLIQLFLLSLKMPEEQNGTAPHIGGAGENEKAVDLEKKTTDNYDIWCVIGHLWYGHPVTGHVLEMKAKMWFDMHPPDPRGTIMYKRDDNYHVRILTKEIEQVLKVSDRTAQRLLQTTRQLLKKRKNDYVTVEEFCFINFLDETTIRKKLAEIYGED